MTTRKEDITSQVDGVTDIFTTSYAYQGNTLMLGYNGQVYPVGTNIINEIDNMTFKISFIPIIDCTDGLHIIYEDLQSADDEPMKGTGRPPGFC